MEIEKTYSVKEAAEASGYNEQHIRKLCRARKISFIEGKGGRYSFLAEDVARLVVGRRVTAEGDLMDVKRKKRKKRGEDPAPADCDTENFQAPEDCDGGIKGDDAIKGEPDLEGLV